MGYHLSVKSRNSHFQPIVSLPSRRRGGFSLIELLVVISIVALLVGILLPALGKARAAGRNAMCLSNMRQIGLGVVMYADEHDGYFPETTHSSGLFIARSWVYRLGGYFNDVDQVRICPEDPKGQARLDNPIKSTSYTMNEYVAVDGFAAQLRLWAVPRPSETVTAFELENDAGLDVSVDHTHSRNWFTAATGDQRWNSIRNDIQPDRHLGDVSDPSGTNGSSNFLYVDGHVVGVTASQVHAWADEPFDFARPPL